jgi:regulator of protease activity HflC (stomatin/prohibitin superfamily)
MEKRAHYQESLLHPSSAWPFVFGFPLALIVVWTVAIRQGPSDRWLFGWLLAGASMLTVAVAVCALGFFIVTPNHSRVLVLFGRYRGTVREEGFYWTNPFTSKRGISLRAHNVASEKIKVNDLLGNPIEIGAVIVWRVHDTAQAMFDVEDHEKYVDVQVETAIREIAKGHPYDDGQTEENLISLRGDTSAVVEELKKELQERLQRAGIEVLEARISHLAYAPEIASAMLQRQQATAIIAARQKIVEGAVSIVEQALADLGKKRVIELDDERNDPVGNLLVVLCGQSACSRSQHGQPLPGREEVPRQENTSGGEPRKEPAERARQPFLLRLAPELLAELRSWANQDLRSLNAHIEFLLREAVRRRKGSGG